jgi:putative CocE/NonD family hydrolase
VVTGQHASDRLATAAPDFERLLIRGADTPIPAPNFPVREIRCETTWVTMRDGTRLATDLYLPPTSSAPTLVMRTPYGRSTDKFVGLFLAFARRGYAVISQDCRATGDSEPDVWDFYIYESEDGFDLVDWITRQDWFDGFVCSMGGSYVGQTQWCMATHPAMSAIVPEVSGLGVAINTAHLHLFLDAITRSVGKGENKVPVHYSEMERLLIAETLAGGYFNEPLHQPFSAALLERYPDLRSMPPTDAKRHLWEEYCASSSAERVDIIKQALNAPNVSFSDMEGLPAFFGERTSIDSHTIPHVSLSGLVRSIHAPALMQTGWYDWGLNDALATWELLKRDGQTQVALNSRLVIAPSAHNAPGYHEGIEDHPELLHTHRDAHLTGLLLRWYAAVREGTTGSWPAVIYYLMGANEWRTATHWPVPEATTMAWHLGSGGTLSSMAPHEPSEPDRYTYDPDDPTPTAGGSIVSYVYPPGSVDVSGVQQRADVLVYTTEPLEQDLDVVGPLRMILYASSSALDTDFVARLSDVLPNGRAIQLQSGILRARHRDIDEPALLEPGRIYRFEIDMWATANRFMAGHRLRVDISSADFPHFDRNSNRGGEPGDPIAADQAVYHDPDHPSHLLVSVLSDGGPAETSRSSQREGGDR